MPRRSEHTVPASVAAPRLIIATLLRPMTFSISVILYLSMMEKAAVFA